MFVQFLFSCYLNYLGIVRSWPHGEVWLHWPSLVCLLVVSYWILVIIYRLLKGGSYFRSALSDYLGLLHALFTTFLMRLLSCSYSYGLLNFQLAQLDSFLILDTFQTVKRICRVNMSVKSVASVRFDTNCPILGNDGTLNKEQDYC